ncbi:MAG: hypothetical protein N2593_02045 [Patescibacteria group bacterium]|nr:hypothetical protein [Patescibacteria group bacterium]
MKKINFLIGIIIFLFVFFNLSFFYLSIKLSDEISFYEKKIENIHHENINLEKKLSEISSLEYAKKTASNFGLTEKPKIYFLENLKYALVVKE